MDEIIKLVAAFKKLQAAGESELKKADRMGALFVADMGDELAVGICADGEVGALRLFFQLLESLRKKIRPDLTPEEFGFRIGLAFSTTQQMMDMHGKGIDVDVKELLKQMEEEGS